jgi:hypothetical protein
VRDAVGLADGEGGKVNGIAFISGEGGVCEGLAVVELVKRASNSGLGEDGISPTRVSALMRIGVSGLSFVSVPSDSRMLNTKAKAIATAITKATNNSFCLSRRMSACFHPIILSLARIF